MTRSEHLEREHRTEHRTGQYCLCDATHPDQRPVAAARFNPEYPVPRFHPERTYTSQHGAV